MTELELCFVDHSNTGAFYGILLCVLINICLLLVRNFLPIICEIVICPLFVTLSARYLWDCLPVSCEIVVCPLFVRLLSARNLWDCYLSVICEIVICSLFVRLSIRYLWDCCLPVFLWDCCLPIICEIIVCPLFVRLLSVRHLWDCYLPVICEIICQLSVTLLSARYLWDCHLPLFVRLSVRYMWDCCLHVICKILVCPLSVRFLCVTDDLLYGDSSQDPYRKSTYKFLYHRRLSPLLHWTTLLQKETNFANRSAANEQCRL
jgi:hypothetical protein